MQAISKRVKPFIGTRSFYAQALSVMVPVTIQQLINMLFNMVDNVMVGSLDVSGLAMSAVSVANRPYTIFSGVFFGMTGAAGLMISQYFGANDRRTCQRLFSLELVIGFAASLLFGMILNLFPENIMRIFVNDPKTVAYGLDYLRIIWISYLPMSISNVCMFSMRALGQNRICMFVSMGAMAINALCNFGLIFGHFGLPAMGVAGAALGTLIARTAEMLFYLSMLARGKTLFTLDVFCFRGLLPTQLRAFFKRVIPLTLNEILWSLGMNIYFWSYACISEASLPAVTIAEQISQMAFAMAMGTSSAVSVLVGTQLGAKRFAQAKQNAKMLLTLVVGIGLCCVLACCVLAQLLPGLFGITPELRALATRISIVMGLFAPTNFVYGFCFFCMRAGGNTRSAMLMDSGYMWLVPVPAAFLIAMFLPGKISILTAVLIIQILATLKVVPALLTLKKGKWVKNITETA